ncbi:hypothetical protein CCACVL1_26579 [Corchorus capsularis]|uniref:Uncharacterized protein n=1 Tax=Corchorus capsularis TaxID=210143 RepID=A0A1R3GE68_COCAP|nr:hypothetical protein CCACVL1_26579 [Corchorus capsularis]
MGGTQKGCKRQNYAHVSFWTTPIIQIFLPFKIRSKHAIM